MNYIVIGLSPSFRRFNYMRHHAPEVTHFQGWCGLRMESQICDKLVYFL
jgi:hypothetical protein